jgi:hypothetical protein
MDLFGDDPGAAELAGRDESIVQTQIAVSEIAAPTGEESERRAMATLPGTGAPRRKIDEAGNVIGPRHRRRRPVLVIAPTRHRLPRQTALRVRAVTRLIVRHRRQRARAGGNVADRRGDRRQLRTLALSDFVATTGEEGAGDLHGAKHLFARFARHAACAIALDGAGDERIVHRALGSRRYRIVFRGVGGHSWTAFDRQSGPRRRHRRHQAGAHPAQSRAPRSRAHRAGSP